MKTRLGDTGVLILFCVLMRTSSVAANAQSMHHYVFFGMDREKIHSETFLRASALEGAQLKYSWKELEPEKDAYEFGAIRKDLEFLQSHGKKLFMQLQDSTFDEKHIFVPKYLLEDPQYHGGADRQYELAGKNEEKSVPAGWVARRWDPAVQARFYRLLQALGKEFDMKIEGINLPETAVEFGETGRLFPKGFTPAKYRDAILTQIKALKSAFPKSVTLQYANFMPGEWLPESDKGYLKSIFATAKGLKVGTAGPDMLPWKPGQMKHSYPLIRAIDGLVPTGIAVQEGNYSAKNPKTGKPVTLSELYDFAHDYLKVQYVFWCDEEPYFSKGVIPYLEKYEKLAPARKTN